MTDNSRLIVAIANSGDDAIHTTISAMRVMLVAAVGIVVLAQMHAIMAC